jgi:hypothetical protein
MITYFKDNNSTTHFYRRTIPVAAYMYNLHHRPPEDERMTLETYRGTSFYVIYIKTVYQVGINKGIIPAYVLTLM